MVAISVLIYSIIISAIFLGFILSAYLINVFVKSPVVINSFLLGILFLLVVTWILIIVLVPGQFQDVSGNLIIDNISIPGVNSYLATAPVTGALSTSVAVPFVGRSITSTSTDGSMLSYYQYDPSTKTLKRLSLENVTQGKELVDYFHKNDESLFVLDDGTIVSIVGDNITRYPSTGIQKIRITNNRYVGLSNGKLYVSKDLTNWQHDTSKPSNVIDFDIPTKQNNILHLQTPTENLLLDVNTNGILSREPATQKKYGTTTQSFVKFSNGGAFHNDQTYYKDVDLANIDDYDNLYIVPNKNTRTPSSARQDNYQIQDILTSDNQSIAKIRSNNILPDKIYVGEDIIYR
jgi:hypothetical protein